MTISVNGNGFAPTAICARPERMSAAQSISGHPTRSLRAPLARSRWSCDHRNANGTPCFQVDNDDRSVMIACRTMQKLHQIDLHLEVEKCCRFIQQENLRFLRQDHCDPTAPALPTGEVTDATIGKLFNVCRGHRRGDGTRILGGPLPEQALSGKSALRDELPNA